jgi:pyridinium-3,5-biscarboxylic acid mononucleotide synthase
MTIEIRQIFEAFKRGEIGIDQAVKQAQGQAIGQAVGQQNQPKTADIGFAKLDLDREKRCGFPEVILGMGKTAEWVLGAVRRLTEAGQDVLVTRVDDEQSALLQKHFSQAEQDRLAKTFWLPAANSKNLNRVGDVLVVTAGTGDLPVAQEAIVTTRVMGVNAELITDVGVAGIHRILAQAERLSQADVVIVVAGMDGALPSVVGGLVDSPVIACPTSIGYGASFSGVAALLTMLNSCSAGVAVVNIDAGFKAGYLAARMVKRLKSTAK